MVDEWTWTSTPVVLMAFRHAIMAPRCRLAASAVASGGGSPFHSITPQTDCRRGYPDHLAGGQQGRQRWAREEVATISVRLGEARQAHDAMQADLVAERQAHAATQVRLEAGRAELDAAGRQLAELRTQFSTELERAEAEAALARQLLEELRVAPPGRESGRRPKAGDPAPTEKQVQSEKQGEEQGAPTAALNPDDGSDGNDGKKKMSGRRSAGFRPRWPTMG